jgi:hypothetical protein
MADFIYSSEGQAQGFRLSNHIYTLDGAPVGRVFAEKVYNLQGGYIGLLVNNMVLDKPDLSRRSMPPASLPPSAAPVRSAEARRPVCEAYPDAFPLLLAQVPAREPELEAFA